MTGVQRFYGQLTVDDVAGAMRRRGPWAAGTVYRPGDVVTNGGSSYVVLTAHTAAATFVVGTTYELLGSAAGVVGNTLKLVRITTDNAPDVPLRITAADAQSGSMFEALNAAGAARFVVGPAGQTTIATGNTGAVPITVNALAGTTGDLQQWQLDSAKVANVTADGRVGALGVDITAQSAVDVALRITGASGQQGRLIDANNSTSTSVFRVNRTGAVAIAPDATTFTPLSVYAPPTSVANTALQGWFDNAATPAVAARIDNDGGFTARKVLAAGTVATSVPVIARAATGQTADLQQWQNSSSGILARVTSTGAVRPAAFTTAALPAPATAGAGAQVFDTTRGMMLVSNGTAWRKTDGTDPDAVAADPTAAGVGGRTMYLLGS